MVLSGRISVTFSYFQTSKCRSETLSIQMELDLQQLGLVTVSGWSRQAGRPDVRTAAFVSKNQNQISSSQRGRDIQQQPRRADLWPLSCWWSWTQQHEEEHRVGSVYALVQTCFQWNHVHLILILQIHNTCCFDRIHWIWIIKVSKDTKCVSSNLEGMWKMRRGDKTCFLNCESAERSFKVELLHFISLWVWGEAGEAEASQRRRWWHGAILAPNIGTTWRIDNL